MRTFIAIFLMLSSLAVWAEPVQITHNGVRLNANWERASGSQVKPRLYLLLHGTLAHNKMEIIHELQQRLRQAGQDSLAINLSLGIDNRASEMYPCAIPHRHQHQDAITEIGAWLAWAKQQGVQQMTLVGHSRGGNQAVWAAATLPQSGVDKLVLLAPMTWTAAAEQDDYQKRYGKSLDTVRQQANAQQSRAGAESLMQPVDFIYCPQTVAQTRSVLEYYAPDVRKDTLHWLKTLQLPTLVLVATEDTTVADLPARLTEISNTQVQVRKIEGADHFFRDLYLDEAAEAILAF